MKKITKAYLQQIIREEYDKVMSEQSVDTVPAGLDYTGYRETVRLELSKNGITNPEQIIQNKEDEIKNGYMNETDPAELAQTLT